MTPERTCRKFAFEVDKSILSFYIYHFFAVLLSYRILRLWIFFNLWFFSIFLFWTMIYVLNKEIKSTIHHINKIISICEVMRMPIHHNSHMLCLNWRIDNYLELLILITFSFYPVGTHFPSLNHSPSFL